jgi:hypothetical protein
MRAGEGDETIKDYAVEGKQTPDRIKDTRRAGSPLRMVRRITNLFGSKSHSLGGKPAN